jgi:hypothetical protein
LKRDRPQSERVYPPGHFTELLVRHNWPPNWQPAPLEMARDTSAQKRGFSAAKRAAVAGTSWAASRRDDE